MLRLIFLTIFFFILAMICDKDLFSEFKMHAPRSWKGFLAIVFFNCSAMSFKDLLVDHFQMYSAIKSSFGLDNTFILEMTIFLLIFITFAILFAFLVYLFREKGWFGLKKNQPVWSDAHFYWLESQSCLIARLYFNAIFILPHSEFWILNSGF